MKVFNIMWDVDPVETLEDLKGLPRDEETANMLGVSISTVKLLSESQFYDYVLNLWRKDPTSLEQFLGLPNEVEVPEEVGDDEEDISDWLSDTFGYCHYGFEIDKD